MFGKNTRKFDPSEYRVHDRHVEKDLKIYIDRALVEVLDYSDGGVRVRDNGALRRVVVIEVFRGGKQVRETVAVQAWQRGGQAGYAFRPKQKVVEVADVPRVRRDTVIVDRNDTGGVAGNALRNRLKI